MSILSVDQISPIGSGTTITLNATEIKTGTEITVGTGASIFSPAGNTLTFGTNNVERIRIKNDGSVLIGTTTEGSSSADTLTIAESANSGITIRSGTSNTGSIHFSDGTSGADEYMGIIHYNHSSNYMSFWTNGDSEKLRIASDGRVTTSTTGVISQDFGTTSSTGAYLHFDLGANGANIGYMGAGNQLIAGATTADLGIRAGANFCISTGGTTERLRITNTGRLGINNISPQYVMHAKHNGEGSGERIDLHMTNDTTGHSLTNGVQFGYQNTAGAYIWNFENTPIYFGTNNSQRVTITSDGSVNKPNNPAFYAYLTANNAVYTAGTVIPWDGTDIDTRSAFTTSGTDAGKYTIPTTGIYYFGWRLNRRDNSRFDIAIYKNGSIQYIDELRWAGTSGMWMAESSHYLMSCTAGQKIDLRIYGVTNAGTAQFDGGGNGYYDAFFGWMVG